MDNFDLKQYLAEGRLNEDKSKKNSFLGIFRPGKDVFQRIIKGIDQSQIQDLIDYTKSQGDEVDESGDNKWGITSESGENGQAVWQYLDGDLYFVNPNFPSVYDDYIRKNM
jgi:hypothetical protein